LCGVQRMPYALNSLIFSLKLKEMSLFKILVWFLFHFCAPGTF
jgi:hypothetical protein